MNEPFDDDLIRALRVVLMATARTGTTIGNLTLAMPIPAMNAVMTCRVVIGLGDAASAQIQSAIDAAVAAGVMAPGKSLGSRRAN